MPIMNDERRDATAPDHCGRGADNTVRRLSKREVRLIILLAAVAVLALVGIALTPPTPPNPEEVQAYYISLFERTQTMTITPASGGEPVRVTEDAARALFRDLAWSARAGFITGSKPSAPPAYVLDLTLADGTTVKDIQVGFDIEAKGQPARGKIWLVPGFALGSSPTEPVVKPPMVATIDAYLESRQERPGESADKSADKTTGEKEAGG